MFKTGPRIAMFCVALFVVVTVTSALFGLALVEWTKPEPKSQEDKFISAILAEGEEFTAEERIEVLVMADEYCEVYRESGWTHSLKYLELLGATEGQATVFGAAARQFIC